MKVICITREVLYSNGTLTYRCITVDKVYTVIKEDVEDYYIINDLNEEDRFKKLNFRLLSDVREEKLNELGIN